MEPMTREKMIDTLTAYCKDRPVLSGCSSCKIKRPLSQGFGCVKIQDRSDEMLAVDIEKIEPPKEQLANSLANLFSQPEPKPSVKYLVTVDRDMLRRIRGELLMLSRCVGATITEAIGEELGEMAEAIYEEIEACDREALEAEKAMHVALQRELVALEQKEKE